MIKQWLLRAFGKSGEAQGAASSVEAESTDEIAFRVSRDVQRQDMYRATGSDDRLLRGYRFCATIQLRTPLRALQRHGELYEGDGDPPVIATESWEGIWIPEPKSFRELGLDIDDFPISTMASDIGQIPSDGGEYLKFLRRVRSVVETEATVLQRRKSLRLLLHNDQSGFVPKLGGEKRIVNYFFPSFVSTVPGLTEAARDALIAAGFKTPHSIIEASDQQLLAFKGIGPARLKAIRSYCMDATNPQDEYIDNVQR